MKNSLSGSLINELEVISIAFEERIKATNKLNELKEREKLCRVKERTYISKGYILYLEPIKKKK